MDEHRNDEAQHEPESSERRAENEAAAAGRQAGEQAREVAQQARERAEGGRDAAAGQVKDTADALHSAADSLHEAEHDSLASYVDQLAHDLGGLSESLRQKSLDELMTDARHLARSNPTLFLSGAFASGLFLGRFARSSDRHEHRQHEEHEAGTFAGADDESARATAPEDLGGRPAPDVTPRQDLEAGGEHDPRRPDDPSAPPSSIEIP
jgi:hypothetical protein